GSGAGAVAAVGGVGPFSSLSVNKAGVGYTLTAADGSLAGATSTAFTVTAAAAIKLVFVTPPGNTTAGVALSPAVQVAVADAFNNVVTPSSASGTLAPGRNPGRGPPSGTTTPPAPPPPPPPPHPP